MSLASSPAVPLADRLAIEALAYTWCDFLDRCRYTEIPALFSDDGRYAFEGHWDVRGRDALISRYASRTPGDRASRHSSTNLRVTVAPDGSLRGTGILVVYRHEGEGMGTTLPVGLQDFTDRYVQLADGTWRFAERVLQEIFSRKKTFG